MKIKITKARPHKRKPKPTDESTLGFGRLFCDHFFLARHNDKKGWYESAIVPYGPLKLDPAAICFHYGQAIFEGMKAYRGKDNSIYLFRPTENIKRMNVSAERLCMPAMDPDLFMEGMKKLVLLEKEWIPRGHGTSMYIRPTMIGIENALGVHPSTDYLFYIIVGPVGTYYATGFSPTKIYVEEEFVRAAPGGVGYCKAAGNYTASLLASRKAMDMGFTQVLWLDGRERKYVEEVGTSNIFFLIGKNLATPNLSGTILPGVTRDSVIQLARSWGTTVEERPISIDEVTAGIKDGAITEVFASGTAAIVSPVGEIFYKGTNFVVNERKIGPVTERLYNEILQIQYGEKKDPFGWRVKIAGP